MAMQKRRMRGGLRQATYAKLCRVATLPPGQRDKPACVPACRPCRRRADAGLVAALPPLHPSPTPQPPLSCLLPETAMDPDPHPRGAIATLPPSLPFSRLPGTDPETSPRPQG